MYGCKSLSEPVKAGSKKKYLYKPSCFYPLAHEASMVRA